MAGFTTAVVGGMVAGQVVLGERERLRQKRQAFMMEKQAKERERAEIQTRQINRERKNRVMTRRRKRFETGTGVSITAPGMTGSGVAGATLGGSCLLYTSPSPRD